MSIKKESIEHWKIMIEWVEAQDKDSCPDRSLMGRKIKMDWRAWDCPYCMKYLIRYSSCFDCPISKSDNCCNDEDSIWYMINDSTTWSEWLVHANDMLSLLESLPEPPEEE